MMKKWWKCINKLQQLHSGTGSSFQPVWLLCINITAAWQQSDIIWNALYSPFDNDYHTYITALQILVDWMHCTMFNIIVITSDIVIINITSSSAMAERPCELDQWFQMGGGSIWGYDRLRSYFSHHCDTTQFTLKHHMVNKQFLLLGLAAEYRSRRRRRRCANNIAVDHQMFMTLTGQLSWQRLRRSAVDLHSKSEKIALWATL